jgi:RecA-family ATPase
MADAVDSYAALRARQFGSQPANAPEPWDVIDPRSWTQPARARQWLVPDWIPIGVVTALYGDGGVGKSLIAQQLMTSVALALPWLGLDVSPGRAIGLMCEDDEEELHRRQDSINAALGVSNSNLENMRLISRVGEDNVLMQWPDRGASGETTPAFAELRRQCALWRPRLIVLDTIADFFGGNELDRTQVRQFVQGTFGVLAREFQCAVVACGHPSAAGISSGAGTGGSTAWSNTVRSRLYLSRQDGEDANPDQRKLARMKANYAPREADITLGWRDGMFDVDGADKARTALDWPDIEKLFIEIDAAWRAVKPWSMAPQTKKDGRFLPLWAEVNLGLSARAVQRQVEQWLVGGFLSVEVADERAKLKGLKVKKWLRPEE